MKTNDPRLTSFVLGELNAEDSRLVQQAMATDSAIAAEITAIEKNCNLLKLGYANQTPQLNAVQRGKVFAANDDMAATNVVAFKETSWLPWAGAIGAAAAAVIAITYFAQPSPSSNLTNFAAMQEAPLTQRLAFSQTPWDGTASAVTISTESESITNSPKQYRDYTTKAASSAKVPAQATSQPSRWMKTTAQSSTTLPLVAGNFSWNWLQDAPSIGQAGTDLIRTEEIVNFHQPDFSSQFTVGGLNARVSTVVAPWNQQAIVAVVQLHNPTSKTIKNLSTGVTVNEQVQQFRVIGYTDPADSNTLIGAQVNAEAGYKHTLLIEMDLKAPVSDIDTLFHIHLRAEADTQTGTYGFSLEETPDTAAQVLTSLAYWSQWKLQSNATANTSATDIQAYLDKVISVTSDSTALTMLKQIKSTL